MSEGAQICMHGAEGLGLEPFSCTGRHLFPRDWRRRWPPRSWNNNRLRGRCRWLLHFPLWRRRRKKRFRHHWFEFGRLRYCRPVCLAGLACCWCFCRLTCHWWYWFGRWWFPFFFVFLVTVSSSFSTPGFFGLLLTYYFRVFFYQTFRVQPCTLGTHVLHTYLEFVPHLCLDSEFCRSFEFHPWFVQWMLQLHSK